MPMLEFAITGPDAAQAAQALTAMLTEIAEAPPEQRMAAPTHVTIEERGIEPISLASLIVAIPCGVLACLDLVERLRKRPKVEHVIALAQQLTINGNVSITVTVNGTGVPMPVASLTPDKLLELAAKAEPFPK